MTKAVTDQRTATDRKPKPRHNGDRAERRPTTAEGRTDRPKAQGATSERRRRSADRRKRENPSTPLETAEKPEDSHRGQTDNGRKTARK